MDTEKLRCAISTTLPLAKGDSMINYEISRQLNDQVCHIYSFSEGCLLIYLDRKCDRIFTSVTSVKISAILEYFISWDSLPPLNELDSYEILQKGLDNLIKNIDILASEEDYFRTNLLTMLPTINQSMETTGVLSLLKLMNIK